jgi:phage terminase small subunit
MGRTIFQPVKVVPEIGRHEAATLVRRRHQRKVHNAVARRKRRELLTKQRAKDQAKQQREYERKYGQLTFKEEWFCRNYLASGGVVYQSAIDAGYVNGCQGSFLLRLPKIQSRIEELQANALLENGMDIAKVMKNLAEFANREIQGDPGNDRNTIAANVELAKMLGAYTEKVRLERDNSTGTSLADLDLPIETQKMLLDAIRKSKTKKELAQAEIDEPEEDESEDDGGEDEEEFVKTPRLRVG